jgi:ubiquinone/menaquinone biosynthesis C-methylase UbiE
LLFRASGGEPADQLLSYTGLDVSPLALCAARLFHLPLLGEHFRLVLSEGSDLDLLPDNSSDCSISVGVVNHVARPLEALEHLIRITREAVVMALWATGEDEGFWAFNHSGYSNYFFSTADLRRLANKYSKGRFYVAEYVPELASSQPGSYIGVSPDRLEKMGSYILIYSRLERLPAHLARIDF